MNIREKNIDNRSNHQTTFLFLGQMTNTVNEFTDAFLLNLPVTMQQALKFVLLIFLDLDAPGTWDYIKL